MGEVAGSRARTSAKGQRVTERVAGYADHVDEGLWGSSDTEAINNIILIALLYLRN